MCVCVSVNGRPTDPDRRWLSGIHRDVVLYVKEPVFIADYKVSTPELPDQPGGSAPVNVEVMVNEAVTRDVAMPSEVEVETLLFDAEGRQVAGSSAFLHTPHNHTSRFIKPPSLDSPHSHLSRRWAR